MLYERLAFGLCCELGESEEGMQAFLEKRPPQFTTQLNNKVARTLGLYLDEFFG